MRKLFNSVSALLAAVLKHEMFHAVKAYEVLKKDV